MMFNVMYENTDTGRVHTYCGDWMHTKDQAEIMLDSFKSRYLNKDGTGKVYPNGKGTYPFRNPRVVFKS